MSAIETAAAIVCVGCAVLIVANAIGAARDLRRFRREHEVRMAEMDARHAEQRVRARALFEEALKTWPKEGGR